MDRRFTSWSLGRPSGIAARILTTVSRGAGAILLGMIGLIHVLQAPLYVNGAPYIGVLFFLASAGSAVAALAIIAGIRGAWILGALVAAGTFSGLVAATTVGLPHFMDTLDAPLAMSSLVVEGLFLGVYTVVAVGRRDPLGA